MKSMNSERRQKKLMSKKTIYPDDGVDSLKELLLGHTVTKVDSETLRLDDGRVLKLNGNWGCGGCTSGNYALTALNDCPVNAIMDVEVVEENTEGAYGLYDSVDTKYRLFVLAQDERIELATFDGSDGNGYYGTGFWIEVSA